jgi:adenine deaminase
MEGFLLITHCDNDQKNSVEHIREVVEHNGVNHVDHGTNKVEDERLLKLVREQNIGLTCYRFAKLVATIHSKDTEINRLLHGGFKFTAKSDDPVYFRAYLNGNVDLMAEKMSLTRGEPLQSQKNAFEISRISPKEQSSCITKLEEYKADY